ncbi:PepSY-associated TM helix domain-containing protein [Sphingomonas sp. AX6]|uniref:PepSY-associated TM helix domain-containing protein n=1 Tax=Sphingomonas sp. AX6 TaxID=2653171 RepID=UPI0012F4434C|nr:PepSY-associated TM helix domain-containing protein [Sphingomonas sp. AX6]VXC71848.1 Peptidase [Sphingomonas sp. AX6]
MKNILSSDLVRRALSGHAAVGLLAGALLYILCLSGTLIVVHQEWQRWEQPTVAEATTLSPEAVQRAADTVLATEPRETEHFYITMPTDGLPRPVVTTDNRAFYLNANGSIAAREEHAWTEFLIHLHYYLHLPMLWGLIAVGALGVMMVTLIVGGVLAHPRIFRDAFRLRARGQKQLALADWHNRLGVWTLPFGLAIAVTGALLGLSILTTQITAKTWYGGDVEAAYAPIFGAEGVHDDRPAPLANIAGAMRDFATRFPDVRLSYVTMHDPGKAGQHLQLVGDHPRRLIFGEYYVYDSNGNFLRTQGLADGEIGKQAASSTYKLHFGSFGGLPVKLAYILMGAALTVVAGTGMSIWLVKRRQRGRASPRLEGAWQAVLWASPLLIALALVARWTLGVDAPLVGFFWIGLASIVAVASASADGPRVKTWLASALGAVMVAIGAVHLIALGGAMQSIYIAFDLILLAGGAALLRCYARAALVRRNAELVPTPAE